MSLVSFTRYVIVFLIPLSCLAVRRVPRLRPVVFGWTAFVIAEVARMILHNFPHPRVDAGIFAAWPVFTVAPAVAVLIRRASGYACVKFYAAFGFAVAFGYVHALAPLYTPALWLSRVAGGAWLTWALATRERRIGLPEVCAAWPAATLAIGAVVGPWSGSPWTGWDLAVIGSTVTYVVEAGMLVWLAMGRDSC